MCDSPRPRTNAAPMTTEHHHGDWTFSTSKSHILQSGGERRIEFESQLAPLPQTPEMVFADNLLRVEHLSGAGIVFTALDALRLVNAKEDLIKVSVSRAWLESRLEDAPTTEVVKPFDWTYTTDYKGTLYAGSDGQHFQVQDTTDKIDIEKLKVREKILYYDDMVLFEDELSDNGSSTLRVKIRVMLSGFFILLRFFMRVDDVIIRLNDTRIHHQFGSDHMIREYTSKDELVENIQVKNHQILLNADEVASHLTLKSSTTHKICLPSSKS